MCKVNETALFACAAKSFQVSLPYYNLSLIFWNFPADMKSLLVFLLISMIAVLVQSTVTAMPMTGNAMNHGHMAAGSIAESDKSAMKMFSHGMSEECCQQDCHCDMSLCHAGLMIPAKPAVTFSIGLQVTTTAPTSPALAAYSSPPFRPPIHA